jgi:hypothetical protein
MTAVAGVGGGAVATMTEPRAQDARRPVRTRRPAYVTYGGSAVAFAAVLAALSWQVATGADPAIGEAEPAAAPAEQVVVRRVVRRVVVRGDEPVAEEEAPAPAAAPDPPAAPAPAPTTGAS